MPRKNARPYRGGSFSFNMTPLIDCTFLLLTFFMLTSHFASAEKTEMELPSPHESQAQDRRIRDKVIINLLYTGADTEPAVNLGGLELPNHEELARRLGELAAENPNAEVILRADRRLRYPDVRRVMELVGESNLSKLQVVTELEGGR